MKKGLHWFRKDLRVQDNRSLKSISNTVDSLSCVYVISSLTQIEKSKVPLQQTELIGEHKQRFVKQSLVDLDSSLKHFGQGLCVLAIASKEETSNDGIINILIEYIDKHDITHVSCEWHAGVNERHQWALLQQLRPELTYIQANSATLYEEDDLPFSVSDMPDTFSPFRRKVEKHSRVAESIRLNKLPPPIVAETEQQKLTGLQEISLIESSLESEYSWLQGGETSALSALIYYFWESDNIASYKETRNGLDGRDFSSKLSLWLAHGCISPRQIAAELRNYESQRTKNDSTYWLFFELLWREFFHWQLFKHQARFFYFNGIQDKALDTTHDPSTYLSWVNGNTGFHIVDACMKQLKRTGFMSNRGRQLVASCFVHELAQDWRYGAAYFEYQLIDFDVASNYGNWQYLAGVGSDPRGHRQFNLEKQTEIYDPSRWFIKRWLLQDPRLREDELN
ncbi:DASH family cryptochrome [Glaciecola sp. MF2-115]|uniref:DASH family cryptochrome n=1 Tax=Glaciecola sp. MF2-115 TaxID=3384827 RepID=UPI0039A071D6